MKKSQNYEKSETVTELKDLVHIKRPYNAEITAKPKLPLTKRQRNKLVELFLEKGIIAYKKRIGRWNLAEDSEDPKAYNPYVGGYNPEKIAKDLKPINRELTKYKDRVQKLIAQMREKGTLSESKSRKLRDYSSMVSKLEKEKEVLSKRFGAGKFKQAQGGARLFNDDIGQEAVIFFYRCLDKFDVSKYDGAIGDKNYENEGGKKTKKTLEFYFQNFLFTSITNCAKDAIKKQASMGFGVFTYADSKTVTYNSETITNDNIHIEKKGSNDPVGLSVIKLEIINSGILSIDSQDLKDFINARVQLPKDVVQNMYGKNFNEYNDQYMAFRYDVKLEYEKLMGKEK